VKRLIAVVLLATLVFSSASLTKAPVSSAQDKIEITFVHAFNDENRQNLVLDVVAEFEASHPNVTVNVEPKGSYREALDSAMLGAEQGNAPHIVQVFEVGTQQALDSGVFIPVSSVASEDQLASLDDIIEPVRNYYTVGEDVWSLPWNSSNPILYYNEEIFAQAGIDTPPETYGEVLADCDIIMNTPGIELQGCIGWNMHSWFVEQWVAEQGALLANNDNGRTDRATDIYLDSDAMMNIFTWWQELANKGYYIYTGALEDWSGSDAIFTGQQVAMHITSTADLVNITEAGTEAGFSVGTGLLPIADDATRNGVVVGGASIWLTGNHPQPELEAAVEFMLALGSTENMVKWHEGTGYFPIRYSSIDQLQSEGWFDEHPTFKTAFDQLTNTETNYATGGALLGNFLETRTIIENAAQLVVDQGVSPADALSDADALADESLQFYNEEFQ
jgi:sn-glycerol 3-phosphate transport system substrate-binding protein